MKKNLNTNGRVVRLILSAILFLAAFYSQSLILLGVALFVLYEAIASWCVLYQLLGINHCPLDNEDKQK